MNCSNAKELMSEFIDGILDAQSEKAFVAHLDECPRCQRELMGLRKTVSLVHDLGEVDPPADFLEQIHTRLGKSGRTTRSAFTFPLMRTAIAAGLLALVSLYGITRFTPPSREAPREASEFKAESVGTEAIAPEPETAPPVERRKLMDEALEEKTIGLQASSAPPAPPAAAMPKPMAVEAARAPALPGGLRADKAVSVKTERRAEHTGRIWAGAGRGGASADKARTAAKGGFGIAAAPTARPATPAIRARQRAYQLEAGAEAETVMADSVAAAPEPFQESFGNAARSPRLSTAVAGPLLIVTTADRPAVERVLAEFQQTGKEKKRSTGARMRKAKQVASTKALHKQAPSPITLRIQRNKYPDLIAKLRNLGDLTVKPMLTAADGKVDADVNMKTPSASGASTNRFITIHIQIQ